MIMKNLSLAVCLLVSILILGGCVQTKQILIGPAVPAKAGYYIYGGQEWKTLEQLEQLGAVVPDSDVIFSYDHDPMIKDGGANIVPFQVVGDTIQVAWRLTPLEYEGRHKLGGALDHVQYSIWVDGIKSKNEVSLNNNVIDLKEDLSMMDDKNRYVLFKYKLGSGLYAIHLESGWIVATVR